MAKEIPADPYWTEEAQLGMGTFQYYHREPRPILAQVHVSEERYTFAKEELEIVPVRDPNRKRRGL